MKVAIVRGALFARVFRALLDRLIRWYYHCDIPSSVDVSGVTFLHKGFDVVINPECVLGKDVVIQHGVTIGGKGNGIPIIGNNVYIGCKAIILGGVKIGNNVKIGAGAVVLNDIPDECTAVGVPAKVVRRPNVKA